METMGSLIKSKIEEAKAIDAANPLLAELRKEIHDLKAAQGSAPAGSNQSWSQVLGSCLLMYLLLHSCGLHADEPAQWLCTSQASQQTGETIRACGVGTGKDENAARLAALANAHTEFKKVCGMSEDCHGHAVSARPMRTSCRPLDNEFLCHRLVVFTIQDKPTRRMDPDEAPMKPYVQEAGVDRFFREWWEKYYRTRQR